MAEFGGVWTHARWPKPPSAVLPPPHQAIQSVVATGGVYKGQGRIQCGLVTHNYKAFHVHEHVPVLDPQHDTVSMASPSLSVKVAPIGRVSVARVRPRTSKGITDLLLPSTSTCAAACQSLEKMTPSNLMKTRGKKREKPRPEALILSQGGAPEGTTHRLNGRPQWRRITEQPSGNRCTVATPRAERMGRRARFPVPG